MILSNPPASLSQCTDIVSNQDYAATFNTHLGGYIPYYDRNCFEKANAIDMLIGLGPVTSRLTPNHKQRLYTIMGDLENLSRFWEQILNREANESQRLRDLSVARRPRDETDDSSGEPDREDGVGRHHLNTDHRMWPLADVHAVIIRSV